MLNTKDISFLYFVGIGGIGMSALARYANSSGVKVYGYDRVETTLTTMLEEEGIEVIYEDSVALLPMEINPVNCKVVFTPAVPENLKILQFFRKGGFQIQKRSAVLGALTKDKMCVAVAGTHGKTSVSTMVTHNLHTAEIKCGAFLGGISANFSSNLVLPDENCDVVVTEADEYDRSFLQLNPNIAVITSIDADHLDIYGTYEEIQKAFGQFIDRIAEDGLLICKEGITIPKSNNKIDIKTYSADRQADYCVLDLRIEDGFYCFNLNTPKGVIENIKFSYPGRVNVENFVASAAVALSLGASFNQIKKAASTYKGVKRRFEVHINQFGITYIDDYAHHPKEIEATIRSVKEMYKGRRVLGIFQPHLFSRTQDLADEFAQSLSLLDEVVVLDIYPARENPIPGVSSDMIVDKITIEKKQVCQKNSLIAILKKRALDVVITMGAGDIDLMIAPIKTLIIEKGKA